jgi:tetratricopeptide (TPR) repeat protein
VKLSTVALCLPLAGCAAIGVVAQSDPAAKLNDANHLLYRQDRPIIAERLIREAIDIYRQKGDEIGLASAYRAYGLFFRSSAVERSGSYRERGFRNESVSFDRRYEKSLEYLEKAALIYGAQKRFDALANVNLNAGITYVFTGNFRAACRAFDTSLENMRDNLQHNPAAKPVLPSGYDSYEQFLADTKKRYGCPYL